VQLETEKNARITQIADVLDRPIRNLSKGYRQRVGIAQALTGSPRYVVLDEPTVGLDPMQIVDIRNLIRDLRKSCTVLLSSHILSEISEVCDRVIIIHKGIILAEDTVSNLIGQIGRNNKLYVRIRGREDSLLALLRNIPGVAGVESQGVQEPGSIDFLIECQKGSDLRENIARTLLQADVPLLTLKSLNETLEDVFMNVINEKKEV
jgi:ABC-2 type transport system ATP-binding protein